MPEYQPTRGPRPAKCFAWRAARIATSTRSRFARRQAVGEDNGVVADSADKAARAEQADSGDQLQLHSSNKLAIKKSPRPQTGGSFFSAGFSLAADLKSGSTTKAERTAIR